MGVVMVVVGQEVVFLTWGAIALNVVVELGHCGTGPEMPVEVDL